jgi:hypothetical protein
MNVIVYLVLLSAGTYGTWKYWEQYESVIWVSHWQECSAKWYVNQELVTGVSPGGGGGGSPASNNADLPWFAQQIRDTIKIAICDSGENEVRYKEKVDCDRVREELRLGVGYCVLNKRLGSHSLTTFVFHLWNSWVTWMSVMALAYFMIYGFWRMQTKRAKTKATAEVYMQMLEHTSRQPHQQWHPGRRSQQQHQKQIPSLEYQHEHGGMVIPFQALGKERQSMPASAKGYRRPQQQQYNPPPQSAPLTRYPSARLPASYASPPP